MTLKKLCFLHATPFIRPYSHTTHSFLSRRLTQSYEAVLLTGRTHRRTQCTATIASPVPQPAPSKNDTDAFDQLTTVEPFRVTEAEAGKRLDKLIADRFNTKSRTYIQSLLANSCVTIDDEPATTKSFRPVEHQLITVQFLPTERELPLVPEEMPLDIVYEDEHLLIINKPAGMVVHPAPGNWTGTLVHGLCHRFAEIAALGGNRPGIVHRLDKGTSGLIVVARSYEMANALSSLFASRQVLKEYVAITVGNPAGDGCIARAIDAPIGRSPIDRLRMAVLEEDAGGKAAHSSVETLAHEASGLLHAVTVQIHTGRTHQIRVHMRQVRTPVLGDELYGAHDVNRRYASAAARPMLHAARLSFVHPVTGQTLDVSARLADDMRRLMQRVVYPDFEASRPAW